MTWQEIDVIGTPTRSAVENCSRTKDAHVELELPEGVLTRYAENIFGMWFVELSITGIEGTSDSDKVDGADEPMTSVCFTGTITGTNIRVRVVFFGDVLDHFMVDLG